MIDVEKPEAVTIFKNNLNYYMKKRELLQVDIAKRLHIPTSTVAYWCTGQRYPRPASMQALADLLGVSMSDLMSKTVEEQPDEVMKRNANTAFFDYALLLNEKAYDILIPIMKALASQPEYQRNGNVQE